MGESAETTPSRKTVSPIGYALESTSRRHDVAEVPLTVLSFIVDDFAAVPGCRKAVEECRAAQGIVDRIHEIDWTGVWWRRSGR